MNNTEVKIEIFNRIKESYRTINPELSELLTMDSLSGKEADSLEIQSKRIKKQITGYMIMTVIGVIAFITYTLIGLLKSTGLSPVLGLLGVILMSLIVSIFRLKILLKTIDNQIFLHRLLRELDE